MLNKINSLSKYLRDKSLAKESLDCFSLSLLLKIAEDKERDFKEVTFEELIPLIGSNINNKIHMSSDEISNGFYAPEDVSSNASIGKPAGLWYACGNDWIDWAVSNDWGRGMYIYQIYINEGNMAMIRTKDGILNFNRKFQANPHKYPYAGSRIDWDIVANAHSGIEICPYIGSVRMSSIVDWYYSWDVASGCIWDPSAITGIKLVAEKIDGDRYKWFGLDRDEGIGSLHAKLEAMVPMISIKVDEAINDFINSLSDKSILKEEDSWGNSKIPKEMYDAVSEKIANHIEYSDLLENENYGAETFEDEDRKTTVVIFNKKKKEAFSFYYWISAEKGENIQETSGANGMAFMAMKPWPKFSIDNVQLSFEPDYFAPEWYSL